MNGSSPPTPEDFARLKERLAKLAEEKAYLQLVNELMSRLSALPGLENMIENMLQGIIETIGGTNVLLYYWIDGKLRKADVGGERTTLDEVDDPEVKQVVEENEPVETTLHKRHSLAVGTALPSAWNWVLPLSVGGEVIGVLKIENLQVGIHKMRPFLHNFFNYAAAVLKNDILGETRLKRAYDELKEVNSTLAIAIDASQAANRAKTAFLANMSHELRTPLNAILGFAQLLDRDSTLEEQQRRKLSAIERSGEHLLELINDVLEISRIEAGRLTSHAATFDLRNLGNTVVEMMQVQATAKQLNIDAWYAPDLPNCVSGDEAHLRQVLLNLLSNAVKYSDRGKIVLSISWDGGRAHFQVEDDGQGIAPEDQQKIFDPFYQTVTAISKADGTGLGLAISRDFVRLMGGDLKLESEIGVGSRFFFAIPLKATAEGSDGPVNEHGTKVVGLAQGEPAWRVLIADDDSDNLHLLSELLETLGFHVQTVSNGEEALAVYREFHPHFVWMDLHMPIMDGIEAALRIRNLSDGVLPQIALMTATAFEPDQRKVPLGLDEDLVRKPFHVEEVLAVMQRRLGLRYCYDENNLGNAGTLPDPMPCDLRTLNTVDQDMVDRLMHAAELLDIDSARNIIESLSVEHPKLGRYLMVLVDDYEFEKIQTALRASMSCRTTPTLES